MTRHTAITAMVLGAAALTAGVAPAHHSQAMFDMGRCDALSGTVRTFQFQYPHSWLWVYVPNKQGEQDIWAFEFAAPSNLMQADKRWTRDVVKKGDKVTVNFSPTRDGRKAGSMAAVTLPDGSMLKLGTPACGYRFSEGRTKARAAPAAGGNQPR
jgi:hypothetical protein